MFSYGFLKKAMKFLTNLTYPFKIIGKNKVADGSCILVANHYRMWDIVHVAYTTKEKVHFIAKKELYDNKFIAGLCKTIQAIPVARNGQDTKAIVTALKYLKNGEKIAIFPEGTRNRTDADLLPLKGGAAILAIKAKVPIYPVMALHRQRFWRRTKVVVGDPFEFTEYYDKKLTPEDYVAAENIIRDKMLVTRNYYLQTMENKKLNKKNKIKSEKY